MRKSLSLIIRVNLEFMKTRLNSENTADERYDVEEEKLSASGAVDGDLSERVCDESQPSKTKKTLLRRF